MAYFTCGPYQLYHSRAYAITATEVTGGGHVLPIWLEDFLGDVKHYVTLAGTNLLRIAVAIKGKGASLADCLTAAAQAEVLTSQRPIASFIAKLLSLNR